MSNEIQGYAEARLTNDEGRAVWLSLHREASGQQLMAPSIARVAFRLILLFALLAVALALSWFAASWLERIVAWTALAMLLAQFAFVGHDAGHGSIARNPATNRALGQSAMTLVTGLAFDEWIARHRAHHQFCQDETRDPDMRVDLVVSLTAESTRKKGRMGRWMTRHQGVHIWLLSVFFGHSQKLLSQAAVLADPARHRLDFAVLCLHFMLWFGVPCWLFEASLVDVLLAYLIPLTLLGPYLASIFWINHVGMPLVRSVNDFSFFEHQVVTSRTIVNPPGLNWLFGGLNYQIEHHLFPQVPSSRLAALHSIVREHFGAKGIPYDEWRWIEAVRAVADHLHRVGRTA